MSGLRFDRISIENNIKSDRSYPVKVFNPVPNCVSARNGRLLFGKSNMEEIMILFYRSKRNRRFWWIPPWVRLIAFPNFKTTKSGVCYGELVFIK